MFFNFDIDTPANTLSSSPVTTTGKVVRGKITQVVVFLPPGSNGLAHLKILWGLHQLFPANEEGDFNESGTVIAWPEDIDIDRDPAELTFVTWNDDDTYDHTVHISLAMQPAAASTSIDSVITALESTQRAGTPPVLGL